MKLNKLVDWCYSMGLPDFIRSLRPGHYLVALLAVLLLVFQYRIWLGDGSLSQQKELARAVANQRNRILAEEVDGLRDDPGAVEERARSDLGMTLSDETFFLVLETPQQQPAKRREVEKTQEEVVDSIPEGLFEE
jgi:cell division protein FtsB